MKPVARTVPLPRRTVESALQRLHTEYHARMAAVSSWGASGTTGEEGRAYLDGIVGHFWESAGA